MELSNQKSIQNGRRWSITTLLLGETVCKWENGEYGSMVDINDSNVLRFIDYHFEEGSDDESKELVTEHLTEQDRQKCPKVAEGIVVFWLKWCVDNSLQYDTAKLFDDYYDKCFNDYLRFEKRTFDYWKRKNQIPLEFAKKHVSDELEKIVISRDLSKYLPKQDMDLINDLTTNYISYVRDKIGKLELNPKGVVLNFFSEGLDSKKIATSLKKIDKTGFGPKQFVVIAKEFFSEIGWLSDFKDVSILRWMKQNNIVSTKANKLQNVPEHQKKGEMLETLRKTFQYYNSHGNWEDRSDFYVPKAEKINQG